MKDITGTFAGPRAEIAYRRRDGDGPTLLWLGGFGSDMTGTKAQWLDDWCAGGGRAFVRFDYSGHGASGGRFEDGAISDWAADAEAVLSELIRGPVVLVASSMGAWIGALLARRAAARIAGAVFVAPAPDFTERLLLPALSPEERRALDVGGRLVLPSAGDEPGLIITRRLIEDGRENLVMDAPLAIAGPVRILQGKRDGDVPWRHALAFAAIIEAPEITLTLVADGGHRLSRPEDLRRLADAAASV